MNDCASKVSENDKVHVLQTIDFFFDYASPYGWIAAEKISQIAKSHNRGVRWRPFLLAITVAQKMKLTPPFKTPLKGDYLLHDIKRVVRREGLVFGENVHLNFIALAAGRATLWARDSHPGKVESLVLELYRAHWSRSKNVSETEVVLDIAGQVGLPSDQLISALKSDHIKNLLKLETEAALELGVFGSPTIIVDGENFWGSDRLDDVDRWLETGGW